MPVGGPSRVGTVNLLDKKTRAHVDEELNEVAPGSPEAAFIYKRSDLERVRARRQELGLDDKDEAQRVQVESHKRALANARRAAAAAAEEVAILEARVAEGQKAEKASRKAAGDESAEAKAS